MRCVRSTSCDPRATHHYMPDSQQLDRDILVALHEQLSVEVACCASTAPEPLAQAWKLSLDEVMDDLLASWGEASDGRRAQAIAYLQAFVRELAYDLALFTERRDPEALGQTLANLVAGTLAQLAIAA